VTELTVIPGVRERNHGHPCDVSVVTGRAGRAFVIGQSLQQLPQSGVARSANGNPGAVTEDGDPAVLGVELDA